MSGPFNPLPGGVELLNNLDPMVRPAYPFRAFGVEPLVLGRPLTSLPDVTDVSHGSVIAISGLPPLNVNTSAPQTVRFYSVGHVDAVGHIDPVGYILGAGNLAAESSDIDGVGEVSGSAIEAISARDESSAEVVRGRDSDVRPVRFAEPPGQHMLRIADFLCSPKTTERVFQPLVADLRNEYFAALRDGRTHKAQWIMVRYSLAFVWSFVEPKLLALIDRIWGTRTG